MIPAREQLGRARAARATRAALLAVTLAVGAACGGDDAGADAPAATSGSAPPAIGDPGEGVVVRRWPSPSGDWTLTFAHRSADEGYCVEIRDPDGNIHPDLTACTGRLASADDVMLLTATGPNPVKDETDLVLGIARGATVVLKMVEGEPVRTDIIGEPVGVWAVELPAGAAVESLTTLDATGTVLDEQSLLRLPSPPVSPPNS